MRSAATGEGQQRFFHVRIEAAACHDVVGADVTSGLQQVFGDVRAPCEDADGAFARAGAFGGVAQAGDEVEAFLAFVKIDEQSFDFRRVGEASLEHLHGADGAGGEAHGVGGGFDFAGPDEISRGVENHVEHYGDTFA